MSNKYLTFGNVFKDTFKLLKKNIVKLILAILALIIPYVVIAIIIAVNSGTFSLLDFDKIFADLFVMDNMVNLIMIYLFLFAIGIFVGSLYFFYCNRVIYHSFLGYKEKLVDFFASSIKKIFPFIGLYFLFLLLILATLIPAFISLIFDNDLITGIIIVVNYVFTIWVSIGLGCSFVIFSVEDIKVIDCLKSSWSLTSKKRGKIFLIGFVAVIVFYIVFFIVAFIAAGSGNFLDYFTNTQAMNNSIPNNLFMTFIPIVLVVLFYPIMFTFNGAIFINLKKEKGTLPSDELVNEFMVEEKDDYSQW